MKVYESCIAWRGCGPYVGLLPVLIKTPKTRPFAIIEAVNLFAPVQYVLLRRRNDDTTFFRWCLLIFFGSILILVDMTHTPHIMIHRYAPFFFLPKFFM
jgi:hypothetical protein